MTFRRCSTRSRPPAPPGSSDDDSGRTMKGKGVAVGRRQGRLARQGVQEGRGADRAVAELEGAARRRRASPTIPPPPIENTAAGAADCRRCRRRLQAWRAGGDARSLGHGAGGLGDGRSARRRPRRRREELDLQRSVREAAPRSLLSELHRRAGHGRRGDGTGRARRDPVRVDVRLLPDPCRRFHPHGRHQQPSNIKLAGSHAGVSIGEDGPSQMALEDLGDDARRARLRRCSIPAMPSARSVWSSRWRNGPGMAYMRTSQAENAGHLRADEKFPIGGSKVLRQSDNDVATVVGAGVTVFEALKAHDR